MPAKRKAYNSTLSAPTKPMNKVNVGRQKRREEADLVYGSIHEFVKQQPCVLVGRQGHVCGFFEDRPRIESHHIKSVGSGGEDRNNTLSCCPKLHDEFHAAPLSDMCRRWHLDFKSIAADLSNLYDQENG